jgi:hypothetical protein
MPNIVSKDPFTLTSPEVGRETAIQQPMEFPTVTPQTPAAAPGAGPQPGRIGPPLQRLGDLIQQGAGTPAMPTLQPNVPIGQQPRSVGAASEGFPRVGETPLANMGGKVTFRREPIIKTVGGLEEGPLRNVAPEKVPAALGNEVERAAGGTPDVTAAEKQRLQTKYPDRETRQLVHANGEAIIDATANDRETMKAIHDLKNPDVRQAAINLGESMVRDDGSPIMVNNRMLSGDVTRQQMFEKLLKKGYSPKEIVAAAHRDMEEGGAAGRPGLMRSQPWTTPGEKTGD